MSDTKEFIAGFGIACVNLSRDHMAEDLAEYLILDAGITYEKFKSSGMEECDLKEIRKIMGV